MLRQFARHYQDRRAAAGRPAQALPRRRKFNQGFATVEFVSSALIDLEFHTRPPPPAATSQPSRRPNWRRSACPRKSRCGTGRRSSGTSSPATITRQAITATCGPEVMDADAFGAFEEAATSSIPQWQTPARRHLFVGRLARAGGGLLAFAAASRSDALLRRRGLLETPEAA